MKEDSKYIIASSKPWNKDSYIQMDNNDPNTWFYVKDSFELEEILKKVKPRYIFFLHWNWKVPKEIYTSYECVCFHMTDLPYGRGGSPLQNLITRGHKETKLTAFRMTEEMDAGPIYDKQNMSLDGRAEDIYYNTGILSWKMIKHIVKNQPLPSPQEGDVTIFNRRRPEQSALPKEGSLNEYYDHIRMLDAPTYPLAFIEHEGVRLEFSHAEIKEDRLFAKVIIQKRNNQTKRHDSG